MSEHRSLCPINLAVELLGDRWSLLIVRDVMFADKRHFGELMQSAEGISTNVLAERLARLADAGILTKSADPSHKQKTIYSLTETGIDLLPVVAELGKWGRRHLPVTPQSAELATELEAGGPALLTDLRAKLRAAHLGSAA
ncbi:MAG: transcriptional regulator [Jatrophihabitans sp.]|jgi:DNA-binding HxlR family transcriptional regulator|nr:transcriptional regulator [Jatrophihabitans sp.]